MQVTVRGESTSEWTEGHIATALSRLPEGATSKSGAHWLDLTFDIEADRNTMMAVAKEAFLEAVKGTQTITNVKVVSSGYGEVEYLPPS